VRHRWTEDRIRRELEAFLPAFDAWPPYPLFRDQGRRGLWKAIVKHGGPAQFADEYGLPYRPYTWGITEAEVRTRLRAALRGTNRRVAITLVAAGARGRGSGARRRPVRWSQPLGA
jgi:hypothetical protein